MQSRTVSESLFEEYWLRVNVLCSRIPETKEARPDYWIYPGGKQIAAEIKQIDATTEDLQVAQRILAGEMVVQSASPGQRLRDRISAATKQLRKLAKGSHPAIAVIYNNLPDVIMNPLEPYHLKTAMFGMERIVLEVPRLPSSQAITVLERDFGGGRQVTAEHNTTLSAVAILKERPLVMDIYHNPFAAIPLTKGFLQGWGLNEHELQKKEPGQWQDWQRIGA